MSSTSNPYSAPESFLKEHAASPGVASRWRRLGGYLVDSALALVVQIPLFLGLDLQRIVEIARDQRQLLGELTGSPGGQLTLAASLTLAALNWYLITTRGQSIGKLVARTRIVQLDGSPTGFVHGVVLRSWTLAVPGYLALAAQLLGAPQTVVTSISTPLGWLVTASFFTIFGSERRCGHDYLAGTRVVRAP